MEPEAKLTEQEIERHTLKKSVGRLGLFSLAFGSMIGVGWVTAMGAWFTEAGPLGALLAFAAGGTLMILIGLCYAELTPMMPVAGGEVAFAYKSSGTGASFLVGWYLAFGYLSVSIFEAISVGTVLAYLFPAMTSWPLYDVAGVTVYAAHLLVALFCTAALTLINYLGVRWAAGFQTVLILAFLAITVIFMSAAFGNGRLENAEPFFVGTGTVGLVGGIAAVFVTAPLWFVGFDTIPQAAEEAEADIPPAALGKILIVSIFGATLFYLLVIASTSLVDPWTEITGSELPTAAAFSAAFESRLMVNLILVAALLGLLTSWNGFFLAGSRVLFALGRGNIVPPWLGEAHPVHGTPSKAIFLSGVVTLAGAVLGRGGMMPIVDVGSFCIAVAFLGVSYSAMKLRNTAPDLPRPYRMPGGLIVPRIAIVGSLFILAVFLVPGTRASLKWPLEWVILGTFSLLGALFWNLGRSHRRTTTEAMRHELILGISAD